MTTLSRMIKEALSKEEEGTASADPVQAGISGALGGALGYNVGGRVGERAGKNLAQLSASSSLGDKAKARVAGGQAAREGIRKSVDSIHLPGYSDFGRGPEVSIQLDRNGRPMSPGSPGVQRFSDMKSRVKSPLFVPDPGSKAPPSQQFAYDRRDVARAFLDAEIARRRYRSSEQDAKLVQRATSLGSRKVDPVAMEFAKSTGKGVGRTTGALFGGTAGAAASVLGSLATPKPPPSQEDGR